jgi:hypothetical protein
MLPLPRRLQFSEPLIPLAFQLHDVQLGVLTTHRGFRLLADLCGIQHARIRRLRIVDFLHATSMMLSLDKFRHWQEVIELQAIDGYSAFNCTTCFGVS